MPPHRSGRLSHGWRGLITLFLLSLTWTPVKLEQLEPGCVEAPRVPTMTRCTRCTKDEVPNFDVGAVKNSLPPSTEYCLKEFRRIEVKLTETILNMTLINNEDHLLVARLVGAEEIVSSLEHRDDCRQRETPKTNQLNDKQCLQSESDESEETCMSRLTNALKKLTALLSTEVGRRSLPSCDDFEGYTGKNHTDAGVATVNNNTNSEAATPRLRVLRDRQLSNISFYSSDWVIEGKRISLSRNVIGYGNLPNWFSKSYCPNDPIVGNVNFSTSNYPHLHLVADVVVVKGWNSTVPGLYHEETQLNLSRTSGNEDLYRIGDEGKKLVAAFSSAECRVVDIYKKGLQSYAARNKTVDEKGKELDLDLVREDILMKVEPEITEVDVGGVEETVEVDEHVQQSCEVSPDEFIRLESLYGVEPNTFVRTVLRHQTISPVYSTYSNRTLLEPSPNFSIDVVEQYANSSALPTYDYTLMQVNHKLGGTEWERVVELGASSSASVSAEMGATLLDYYRKTFAFYGKQGPLIGHLNFANRNDFVVRLVKPLEAWELKLQLRVFDWFPLNATFRADESNQLKSFRKPTHPIVNGTVLEEGHSDKFTVKWHLTADSAQLTYLLQMGKNLITWFGQSDGAVEGDGLLDLLANMVTGSTKKEQRRGEEMISEELASMIELALKKLIALSPTAPQEPTTVDEMLLAGWRALWDILMFVGLVAEGENVTPTDGDFQVDFDHFINLLLWFVEPVECQPIN